ncbi:MAG: hypothetical protein MJ232_08015 [archaeon]|nr:hypothetical protein [archaeon]
MNPDDFECSSLSSINSIKTNCNGYLSMGSDPACAKIENHLNEYNKNKDFYSRNASAAYSSY